MASLFTTPVFIKPLGIIVPPEYISAMAITVSYSRNFALVIPDDVSDEAVVRSQVKAQFNVNFTLPTFAAAITKGADAFNAAQRESVLRSLKRQMEEAPVAEKTEKRRGRRGRRPIVEEAAPAVEAAEVDVEDYLDTKAHSFGFVEYVHEEGATSISDSAPFQWKSNISEKNAELLAQKLTEIQESNRAIANLRLKLSAPNQQSVADSMGSLIPNKALLDDINSIDRQGLDNYEQKQRDLVRRHEERIRANLEFFNSRVIDAFNKSAQVFVKPFEGKITFADETYESAEILESLKSEIFEPFTL